MDPGWICNELDYGVGWREMESLVMPCIARQNWLWIKMVEPKANRIRWLKEVAPPIIIIIVVRIIVGCFSLDVQVDISRSNIPLINHRLFPNI